MRCHIVKNTFLHIAFSAILPTGSAFERSHSNFKFFKSVPDRLFSGHTRNWPLELAKFVPMPGFCCNNRVLSGEGVIRNKSNPSSS